MKYMFVHEMSERAGCPANTPTEAYNNYLHDHDHVNFDDLICYEVKEINVKKETTITLVEPRKAPPAKPTGVKSAKGYLPK